jgi:hypothetical protein
MSNNVQLVHSNGLDAWGNTEGVTGAVLLSPPLNYRRLRSVVLNNDSFKPNVLSKMIHAKYLSVVSLQME